MLLAGLRRLAGRWAGALDGNSAAAALLRLALAAVVTLVPSPAAAAVLAWLDAVGQEREPCVVDRADDLVVGAAVSSVIRQSDQPMTFSGRSGPRGRTTNICSACLLELAFC